VFERVDAALGDLWHVVPNLFTPPSDRHVEGIIAVCARRFIVPTGDSFEQRLVWVWQAEVDDHRRATRNSSAGAAFKIIAGIGAHEWHLKVGVRVNAARHDICAARVQRFVAREVWPDLRDHAAFNFDVCFICQVSSNNCTAFDHF